MMVKELIAALANEDDMSGSIFVKIVNQEGDEEFIAVEGIATYSDSYRPSNMVTCTTLLLEA